MKKYDVEVTVNYVFTVEAESEDEAQVLAEDKYYNSAEIGDIIGSNIISIYN